MGSLAGQWPKNVGDFASIMGYFGLVMFRFLCGL